MQKMDLNIKQNFTVLCDLSHDIWFMYLNSSNLSVLLLHHECKQTIKVTSKSSTCFEYK